MRHKAPTELAARLGREWSEVAGPLLRRQHTASDRAGLGELSLDGTLTRQAERTMEFDDQFAHVSNMGRMVEDMEIDMRSSLDGLYIAKTREVINGMRKLQQGPALANPFVGELAGAVLKHGQKQQLQQE